MPQKTDVELPLPYPSRHPLEKVKPCPSSSSFRFYSKKFYKQKQAPHNQSRLQVVARVVATEHVYTTREIKILVNHFTEITKNLLQLD